ncbi:MAG TPA: hypothetical protein VHI13_11680 [Candidatus Kapabacteria bacterium]|nr:hypothetical protein [Candidatus Kapabacteria bacterium]
MNELFPALHAAMNRYIPWTGLDIKGGKLNMHHAGFVIIFVAVYANHQDAFAAFRSRFDELASTYNTSMMHMGTNRTPEGEPFDVWGFGIGTVQVNDFAADLLR